MSAKRNGKNRPFVNSLLTFVLVCSLLIAALGVGYAAGIVPESWITAAETFFNGGQPIEDLSSKPGIVQLIMNGIHAVYGGGGESEYDPTIALPESTVSPGSTLTIEFLDVGQADCTLIYGGNCAMLIDGGNIEDGPLVADYIRALGISSLDYIIGTHAHEDHIGGLSSVISAIPVKNIVLPNTSPSPNGTYAYLCNAASRSGAEILEPMAGASYQVGEAVFTILSADYAEDPFNENEYSTVIKLQFGDTSFLIMGDAETPNERAIMDAGYDISADVLRVGHHGALTSTSSQFLRAVKPADAVISVGANNDYGHPKADILSRLESNGVKIRRTDYSGTIVVETDGEHLTFAEKETHTDDQR